jgi:hypothetical protein
LKPVVIQLLLTATLLFCPLLRLFTPQKPLFNAIAFGPVEKPGKMTVSGIKLVLGTVIGTCAI